MIVDRRAFVAGAALVAATPALRILPADAAAPVLNDVIQPLFMISGWSEPNDSSPENHVWMRVGHGWVTPWR
jgi:hypothetical protein